MVIPALNEASWLSETLASVGRGGGGQGEIEVVVADGGSTDGTVALAEAAGARVVCGDAGRGPQLNAGAAAARGACLLFLHADTRLQAGYLDKVRETLEQPGVSAGAFGLAFDDPGWALRCVAAVANMRSRFLREPYGDQALFMRREMFFSVGGFPDVPLMEDVALVRRLRRRGRVKTLDAQVVTSARHCRAVGVWRSVMVNQGCRLGYALGVAPQRLADWRSKQCRLKGCEKAP